MTTKATENKFDTYSKFIKEIASLEAFYEGTLYAYKQTALVVNYKFDKKLNYGDEANGLKIVVPTISFKPKWHNRYQKHLIEVIYVRLISALEVFLVDIIREIFVITKMPFKRNDLFMNLSHSELLSIKGTSEIYSKIINRECRKLTSGGYDEIIKFYKKYFDVDLNNFYPGKNKIEEYYDIRHLLVHRLGKTDAIFKEKYNYTLAKVNINQSFLRTSFSDFKQFCTLIENQVRYQIDTYYMDSQSVQSNELQLKIIVKEYGKITNIFDNNYEFWVDDLLIRFKDILIDKNYTGNEQMEIRVQGKPNIIKHYKKIVAKSTKKYKVSMNLNTIIPRSVNRNYNVVLMDEVLLEKIKDLLPPQPWQTGIHKIVAAQLETSNKLVSIGIQLLIARKIFKPQVDGVVLDH